MPGQYDRNRGQRWQDDDDERYGYGRGQEPPRDDRGRFLSEGERGRYYGGRDFSEGDYDDRGRGDFRRERDDRRFSSDEDYGRGGYERGGYQGGGRSREDADDIRRDFGNFDSGGRDYRGDGPGHEDYGRYQEEYRGRPSYESQRGRRQGPDDWREQDYDYPYRGQGRGFFGDPDDQHDGPRERWEGSGGSRYDDYEREQRERELRGGNRGRGPERDEQGRFANQDDDDRGGRGRGSQDRGGGEHRGWFGDPRGHAQAARLGWRHRHHNR